MSSRNRQLRNPFPGIEIAAVFQSHPPAIQKRLLALRELIFATARASSEIGEIEETLKWGQASYLTPQTKSGTTVRLDYIAPDAVSPDGACGIYVHCQTNLVSGYRRRQKERARTNAAADHSANNGRVEPLIFEGTRCVRVSLKGSLPKLELREFFTLALTYHLRKKARR